MQTAMQYNNQGFHLFHSPGSRSGRTKMILDLLEVEYELSIVDTSAGQHKDQGFLVLNPFGQVPVLLHDGQVILESAAQVIYLADLFPHKHYSPAQDSLARARYIELFVLSPSVLEPMAIRAWRMGRHEDAAQSISTLLTVFDNRYMGPYFLGEKLYAIDIFVHWGLRFFSDESLAQFPRLHEYSKRLSKEINWAGY